MSVSNEDDFNTLDTYLDRLFHEKVEFSVSKDEVSIIEGGINCMIRFIVQAIENETGELRKELSNEFIKRYPGHKFICDGTLSGPNIVKVGSFYERTKNGFPDEFDFIHILCTCKVEEAMTNDGLFWRQKYFIWNEFHDAIKDVVTKLSIPEFRYVSKNRTLRLKLAFDGYDRREGPASKFKFSYENFRSKIRYIYVDIVPAFKIFDRKFELRLRNVCPFTDFVTAAIMTGNYLITEEVSFTETELLFMKNFLSDKHRIAYRIVKYLFNGNRNGDILNLHKCSNVITSYMIKVAMIKHHCFCKDQDKKISECVITVIELLRNSCNRYRDNIKSPILRKLNGGNFNPRLNDLDITTISMEELVMKLELMKVQDLPLNIVPMSTLIMSDLQSRHSTGEMSTKRSLYSQISTGRSFSLHVSDILPSSRSSLHDSEYELASTAYSYSKSYNRQDVDNLPAVHNEVVPDRETLISAYQMSVITSYFLKKDKNDGFSQSSLGQYTRSRHQIPHQTSVASSNIFEEFKNDKLFQSSLEQNARSRHGISHQTSVMSTSFFEKLKNYKLPQSSYREYTSSYNECPKNGTLSPERLSKSVIDVKSNNCCCLIM